MKIARKKSFFTRKRITVIAIVIIVALLAGGAYWWLYMRQTPKSTSSDQRPVNSVDYSPATPQEKQDSVDAKQQDVAASGQPAPTSSASITISRAGQVDTSVSVRTVVSGATAGTCTATFSKTGQKDVTQTFTIASQATAYTCNGDVPVSSFPVGGEWSLSIVATDDSGASPAATTKVTVTK